jgi:hypothetical protein
MRERSPELAMISWRGKMEDQLSGGGRIGMRSGTYFHADSVPDEKRDLLIEVANVPLEREIAFALQRDVALELVQRLLNYIGSRMRRRREELLLAIKDPKKMSQVNWEAREGVGTRSEFISLLLVLTLDDFDDAVYTVGSRLSRRVQPIIKVTLLRWIHLQRLGFQSMAGCLASTQRAVEPFFSAQSQNGFISLAQTQTKRNVCTKRRYGDPEAGCQRPEDPCGSGCGRLWARGSA